ncbi:adenylosuccinate synthetase [Streptomyces sp. MST-110588]|uniref:adenylosuccinate synthetase n=1 Tax=Streptomyces sp. MST-110588 TaxID=2833628 RepID=UPI0020643CCC|nr:adenylosuccinate synthetase [Streptomyces sp. MST-110588]UNO38762.1 adenylosuccinate synthetase [Streptomyces sp. MST-110588]
MHTIVVDLGYGDAGKGTVVDRLCAPGPGAPPVAAVVRFNGGAQAAHNVLTGDGRHHTFAQFGSGTFHGVPTHLSRHMLVDPLALATEARHLASLGVPDPLSLLTVDRRALLTAPYHAAANRAREQARGPARHGSCGMGIGETAAYALAHPSDAPTAGDCLSRTVLRRKLALLRDRLSEQLGSPPGALPPDVPPLDPCLDAFAAFAAHVTLVDDTHLPRLLRRGPVVFEGAQGVLLDEWHGFHPYTTWSTTTFANAESLLADAGQPRAALRLGVVRTYTTRHGPGPLVTEDPGILTAVPERHNGHGRWQGPFRAGHFDAPAHAYAAEVCGGVDALALTHLDAPAHHRGLRIAHAYRTDDGLIRRIPASPPGDLTRQQQLTATLLTARPTHWQTPGPDPHAWTQAIGAALAAPVILESYGPTAADKTDRRPTRPTRTRTPAHRPVSDRRDTGKSKYVSGKVSGVKV